MRISELWERVKRYEYVSFDVFDTLIYRSISDYHDINLMIVMLYQQRYGSKPHAFPKYRECAEAKARKVCRREVDLDTIYEYLPYEEYVNRRLILIEKEVETHNCTPNKRMVDFLTLCRENGKKIIITTDMYLTPDVFDEIFKKIGVRYDGLFISGMEGVTKRSGRLFEIVLQKLGIGPESIIHIGDDKNNDVLMPRKYGIESVERIGEKMFFPTYSTRKKWSLQRDHLQNIFNNKYTNIESDTPEFRLGYTVIGPFLYEFCQWLHNRKNSLGVERLFFIAREGYLIQKVYENMYPEEIDSIEYLRLNKNLLRLPSLKNNFNVNLFLQSLPKRSLFRWSEIFTHLGVENINELIPRMEEEFDNFDVNEVLKREKVLDGVYDEQVLFVMQYQKNEIEDQYEMLIEYLTRKGFFSPPKIGLVNNSMNGSAQLMLNRLFEDKVHGEIIGFQIIKTRQCARQLKNSVEAFVSDNNYPKYFYIYFRNNCLVIEHLLYEAAGTSRRFYRKGDEVKVLCDKPRKEIMNYRQISLLQDYALMFVDDYKSNVKIGSLESVRSLVRFLQKPYYEDAMMICNLWDDDVEGDRQICPSSELYKFSNILAKNITGNNNWLEGFLIKSGVNPSMLIISKYRLIIGYLLKSLLGREERA